MGRIEAIQMCGLGWVKRKELIGGRLEIELDSCDHGSE